MVDQMILRLVSYFKQSQDISLLLSLFASVPALIPLPLLTTCSKQWNGCVRLGTGFMSLGGSNG